MILFLDFVVEFPIVMFWEKFYCMVPPGISVNFWNKMIIKDRKEKKKRQIN